MELFRNPSERPSGAEGACWALLGPDIRFVESFYDVEQAAKGIERSRAPYADDFAAHIRNPPLEGP
ncbi:hypothetical protein GCM10007416_05660 [Kroppenstedtia guangzhouensis]|uniref:Uncharacterized protein n=1 Tax=Kroppenstedtia guangzhouensis TaxID=1274356 RepID=A0ABQ1G1J3_9BACL|nr:hypothetical protein GCM10007416_05660 [Kroppenstedtia guangzhouensis]